MRVILNLTFIAVLAFASACNGQPQSPPRQKAAVDLEAEIGKIKQKLKDNPNSAELHADVAALAAVKNDWTVSDEEIGTAIKLAPNNAVYYFAAAESYFRRGFKDKAFDLMRSAIAVDPENPLTRFFMGNMFERNLDPTKATAEYQETKKLLILLQSPERQAPNHIEGNQYYDRFGQIYMLEGLEARVDKRLRALHVDPVTPRQN
jgi:cytochrome c-type biogenesis protein CcmH/NrfG